MFFSRKTLFSLLLVVILSGCSAFSGQHNLHHETFVTLDSEAAFSDYAGKFKTDKKATEVLHLQESARLYQIAGDYQQSQAYLAQVLEFYRDSDYDAVINVSGLGAKAASLLTNDKVIPYRGSDYERVYARQLQAMNYLALGDVSGALVEVRAGTNAQRFASEARAQEVDEATEERRSKMLGYADKDKLNILNELVGDKRNGFLSSYMYYFSALLREATGDANGAYIDYRQAWQLVSSNLYLGNNVVRLAERYDRGNQESYQKLSGIDKAQKAPKGSGRVALVVERGFVPPRKEFTVEVQFDYISTSGYGLFWSKLAMPTYGEHDARFYSPVTIVAGDTAVESQFMMNSLALAANQLKEAMPGIVFRQWSRITSKYVASQVVGTAAGEEFGEIAGLFANIVAQGVGSLLEEADTRSWISLPEQIDNAELILPAGTHEITVQLGYGRTAKVEADVVDGSVTIIRVIDNGLFARADQLYPVRK